jgi:dihydroflavonol-4-reductase
MNEKVLITGGTGLVGAWLIRWFRHLGYSHITSTYSRSPDAIPPDIREGVRWVQLALPDRPGALEVVEGHDYVIHAAGLVAYRKKDKYRLLDINRTGTAHITDACLAHGVKHLVYIGSVSAIGKEKDGVTVNEMQPWLDNEFSSDYGLSKYLGELEAWRGAAEGLPVSVVLPSIILGTGDWNRSSLQIVDRVANKIPLYPTGSAGLVDVRDVAAFVEKLIRLDRTGERWLLCAETLPYGEIYRQLGQHLGLKKTFRPAPKWLASIFVGAGQLLRGEGLGVHILKSAYSTVYYDVTKSQTLDEFRYRNVSDSLREIAVAYRFSGKDALLPLS